MNNIKPKLIDSFYDSKLSYPAKNDQQIEFLDNVGKAINHLDQYQLTDITNFKDRVITLLPKKTLEEGEKLRSHFPIRFHLWCKKHKILGTIFKIITLGVLAIIDYIGKKQMERPSFIAYTHVTKIAEKIENRKQFIEKLKKQKETIGEIPLSQRAKLVSQILVEKESLGNKFLDTLKKNIQTTAEKELNSAELWINEEKVKILRNIYSQTNCLEQIELLDQRYHLVSKVKDWEKLSMNDRLIILHQLTNNKNVFEPQLNAICMEVNKELKTEHLLDLADEDIQTLFAIVDILGNLHLKPGVQPMLNQLKTEIVETSLPEAFRKNNDDKKKKFRKICEELGDSTVEAYKLRDKVQRAINLGWKVTEKKLKYHTQLLEKMIRNKKIFDNELEAVRAKVFEYIESLETLELDDAYACISELLMLKSTYNRGVRIQILKAQIKVLKLMCDQFLWEDKEKRDALEKICVALSLDLHILEHFITDMGTLFNIIKFGTWLLTGETDEDRRLKDIEKYKSLTEILLRRSGIPTNINGVPTSKQIEDAKFEPSHFAVAPPTVKAFEGKIDINKLITFLKQSPEGIIPSTLYEPENRQIARDSSYVIERLSRYFIELKNQEKYSLLTNRRKFILNTLKHYTDQVEKRLKEASKNEKKEIYIELKQYILEIVGFSLFHCEDRKYGAANVIFREKLSGAMVDGETAVLVNKWLANRRDEMVTQILTELLYKKNPRNDIASGVAFWRYSLRTILGLGQIEQQAHNLAGGLTAREIIEEFRSQYTPKQIIDWAMEEHNKGDSTHQAFTIRSIFDLLQSRVKNLGDIQDDLLDEDYIYLRREAMALYLQECEVFTLFC